MVKKEITIITEGESETERVFGNIKNWCVENLQEFNLRVKGKDVEGNEKTFEYKEEKNE